MERIRDMLIEFMPDYTIILIQTNKRDEALRADIKGAYAHCLTNIKLIYFIYVTQFCPYISQVTRLRADKYYLILHKMGGYIVKPDVSRDTLWRQIRTFRRSTGEGLGCDVCDDVCSFVHICQCHCVVCHKCMLDNRKDGIYRCVYCQHKNSALVLRGGVVRAR